MNKIGLVWIVDDDKLYQFTAQKTMDKTNLVSHVVAFADGKVAIEALQEIQHDATKIPDIIFLDINMPVMDGWEFLDYYLKMKANVAKQSDIYIVSSSIDTADKAKAYNIEGIVSILVKPISKEYFTEIFQRTLLGKG
jgi:CheY-like chemotaxis protein